MFKHILGLLLLSVLLSACFARGGVVGELKKHVDADLQRTQAAVVATFRVQKITIAENKRDDMSALIKGYFADETPITVHCSLLTQKATSITIQIGLFGDELRSKLIMDAITERLHAVPAE